MGQPPSLDDLCVWMNQEVFSGFHPFSYAIMEVMCPHAWLVKHSLHPVASQIITPLKQREWFSSQSVGFETFRLGGIFQSFIRIDLVLHSGYITTTWNPKPYRRAVFKKPSNLGAPFSLRLWNTQSIIFWIVALPYKEPKILTLVIPGKFQNFK